GLQVAVQGSESERGLGELIAKEAPGAVDLCGKLDLPAMGGFISRCSTFVSNDSGPMHMARALGVPTLAIFGSTDPAMFEFGGDAVGRGENLGEHLAEAGVPWEMDLRLSRKLRPLDVLRDARLLSRWAQSGRFDVLHAAFAHDHHLCLWAASRSRNAGLRVIRA